jgi:hypothetical protein
VTTVIAVRCPVCGWESVDVPVADVPNGRWLALKAARIAYTKHATYHIPEPVRIEAVIEKEDE